MWAAGTLKGNGGQYPLDRGPCPVPVPAALDVARIAGMSAIYLSVVSAAVSLLTAQLDRIRIRYARRVTVIVDLDDDCRPMVADVAATLAKGSRLALIVDAAPTRSTASLRSAASAQLIADAAGLRHQGARIIGVNLSNIDILKALPIWTKLDRLYLLSASPSANLLRLKAINQRIPLDIRRRLALIVRIDDPWQAESWRSQQLGQSDSRWAADAVGIYEVTATRLIDKIMSTDQITTIIACGSSTLTLALCANLVRRRLENAYYTPADAAPLPKLTIVASDAEEFREDHEIHQQQRGLPATDEWLTAVKGEPTMATLAPLIAAETTDSSCTVAVILTAAGTGESNRSLATRLASRFPALPVFAPDPKRPDSTEGEPAPIIGALRTFWPALRTESDQAHDVFERAAMLIHERYRNKTGSGAEDKPWPQLIEFYRGSNRRLVRHAFAIVEQVAEHTWDSFGALPDPPTALDESITDKVERALARLNALGFDTEAAMAMAKAEHESWLKYLHHWGWRRSPPGHTERDEQKKTRPDLVAWSEVKKDRAALGRALTNLADTLDTLRQLGYRSRPQWQRYRRIGEVTAQQRDESFSWTTGSDDMMRAASGDWEVRAEDGRRWSVRDDIFGASYEHVDGHRYRRTGHVQARQAREGETVATLEGPVTAKESDWVIRRSRDDQWVVPADKFTEQYEADEPVVVLDAPCPGDGSAWHENPIPPVP